MDGVGPHTNHDMGRVYGRFVTKVTTLKDNAVLKIVCIYNICKGKVVHRYNMKVSGGMEL
jgi:hypothetical protein